MKVLDLDLMALVDLDQEDKSVVIHLTERDLSLVLGLMEGHLAGQIHVMGWEPDLMQMGDQSENHHKTVTHLVQAKILLGGRDLKIQQE